MNTRISLSFALVGSLLLGACSSGNNEVESTMAKKITPPALIDRAVLFGNPSRFQGRVSPDGNKMSFRAPLDGVMNLWVGDKGNFDSVKAITKDTGRGIPSHFWSKDSNYIFYIQDQNGDENWHLYSVELATGKTTDLTPHANTQAQFLGQSKDMPGIIIAGMNDRDPRWHDIYKVDLASGERTLLQQNEGYAGFVLDNELNVRLAAKTLANADMEWFKKDGEQFTSFLSVPYSDMRTTQILKFDNDNSGVYMLDSRGRNTAALSHMDLASGKLTVLASDDKVDISSILFDPDNHTPVAYSVDFIKPEWVAIDDGYKDDINTLNSQLSGGAQILAQSNDNNYWTVYTDNSNSSPIYKVYDRTTKTLTDMFVTNPKLNEVSLAKMYGVVIKSRDDKDLVSYLTLPLESDMNQDGKPEAKVPMVMLVHGGPWGRDIYGYSPVVQWLANRGYAVLQVNFRSSTGFGKEFTNAGDKQWGKAMHTDLIDAKNWAVKQGVTDANTVAIMGGSYGGYATLAGLTFTPDEFSCGVDIVGPSNLQTLLSSIPPYWTSFRQVFVNAIGDPDTDEGLALLKERSPLTYVDEINKPLLIAQGANDPRVKQAESDQIVDAMKARDIPVTYVLFPDEGHGFQKPENNLAFYAVAEAFLAKCQNGRVQPIGDDFDNSSIQITHGAEFVPGVPSTSVNE
ncbi:S9 family peptidase [Thalassotalea sp. HSM 43]|uniref:S9 family peptidase n=1 Tax=Thalassotalea sp. HSM 43 TaxID=2552945 RepID=UPI0010822B2C|nr:S9 family peptidase [Thalassotalea sp. HSM 43]QBY05756.1 S9 family peptidase [Thalassotalea sp. HSM 43]